MKLFLDTFDFQSVKKAKDQGLIDGVTTNPTLLSEEFGNVNIVNLIKEIANVIYPDPMNVEVTKRDPKDIYLQAKAIANLAPNMVVKIPCYTEYISVIKDLLKDGIKINITLLFSLNQAMLMCKLGVHYISPFVGRLNDIGQNGIDLIYSINSMIADYDFDTKVIVASLRSLKDVEYIIESGVDIATIPVQIFNKMLDHPLTNIGMKIFDQDWQKLNILNFP